MAAAASSWGGGGDEEEEGDGEGEAAGGGGAAAAAACEKQRARGRDVVRAVGRRAVRRSRLASREDSAGDGGATGLVLVASVESVEARRGAARTPGRRSSMAAGQAESDGC